MLIQSLFKLLLIIQHHHPQITINFHKVKSHSDIQGSNFNDKLVRDSEFNFIPHSITLTQIHKFLTKLWKRSWKIKSNPIRWITKFHNEFSKIIHILINQTGIIMRLITEHIELNQYFFKCKINAQTPECCFCNKIESTNHFLIKCKKFKIQRLKLFNKLSAINHKYKYKKFQSIKYSLFPYKLQHNDIKKQSLIWKEVLSCTKETKRFEHIYDINIDKI